MLKVLSIPILKDNYVFILVNTKTNECLVVDPGQSEPVKKIIFQEKLNLKAILLTHHHWDHIGGAQDLKKSFGAKIYAPLKENKLIDFADDYLKESDQVLAGGFKFKILDLAGHTLGHIGYWEEEQGWLFSGDVFFSLGCGRIFDGTAEDHFRSLQKVKTLPPSTWIYCTHEYTELNLGFVLQKLPHDTALKSFAEKIHQLRAQNQPTVPFRLSQELELNPFLKVSSEEDFIRLREERNQFTA